MLGTVHEYDIVIKEHHLDSFGHVNNAVYLELLEEARWDLITKNGFGYDQVQARRLAPAILEINLVFKRELRNRQHVRIRSWLDSHEEKVARMTQTIVSTNEADGQVLHCEARITFGLMDLEARRLIQPTPEWWKAMGLPPRNTDGG